MKRFVPLVVALALASIAVAGAPAAAPKSGSLHIKHFVRGYHNWSLSGGPYRVHQTAKLARGGTLLVTNDDLMVQDLVKTSGPAVKMKLVQQSHMGDMHMTMPMEGKPSPYAMAHMGAQVRVWFPTTGTYHFRLIDRGDYFKNIKTVGPDNMPTLVVTIK